ncbi:MAG TPA: arsenate reductase (glutaredoxin) [Xanthobacteraceae bacterium]|nr:arsenate reductase (glutaredoxin) [Xanthobacteraceae bacterium]
MPDPASRITIWHNPKCSTSRAVLGLLRARGVEPEIVEYLKTPPGVADIRQVLAEAGLKARDLVRRKEPLFRELGLDAPGVDEAALVAAMAEHPILIERPVVRASSGTRLCRPVERLDEIVPAG